MGRERFLVGHSPCLCFASHSRNPRNSRLKNFVKKTRNDIFVIQKTQSLCAFVVAHTSIMSDFRIVKASQEDIPLILAFIRRLAEYERLSSEVVANEEMLRESLFGKRPVAEVILGYYQNKPVGFAVFFQNFSTFRGRPGLYLEDLFVNPEMRGKGFGRAMLVYLAKVARERKCARFEWSVLDWNEPAVGFYRNL